jgi:hypothetical protein
MGSLSVALLREDHIIVGADRRHTRGDKEANYKNDAGLKTLTILSGFGVLSFAGRDVGEQILIPWKNKGHLDGTSLEIVADNLRKESQARYKELVPSLDAPVEFLLAGFEPSSDGIAATSYRLLAPYFSLQVAQFPYRKHDVIGRSNHGALYALHRFGEQSQTVRSDLALAAFLMSEVSECDTTVGGLELYVIRKGDKATRLDDGETARLVEWAAVAGTKVGDLILRGPDSH